MEDLVVDKARVRSALIFFGIFVVGTILVYFLAVNPLLGDDAEGLTYRVSFDLQTNVSDTFTLYYDNLEATRFDDVHSQTVSVKGSSAYQTVDFEIPVESVSYLKFMLGTTGSVSFCIRSVKIESFSHVQKIAYDKISSVFDITERMSRLSDKDGYVSTKTTKQGAYFTNTQPISVKYGKPTLPLISASITLILMSGVLFIMNRIKKGAKKWYANPQFILFAAAVIALVLLIVFGVFVSSSDSVSSDYLIRCIVPLIIFAGCVIIIIVKHFSSGKKNSVGDIITVALFGLIFSSVILVGPFFVSSIGEDYQPIDFTLPRFMEYANDTEKLYTKEYPSTSFLSSAYSDLKTFVFADSQYDDVVIGKNGWLFSADELNDYKRVNSFAKENLVKIRDKFLNYERTFKGQNIAFYILIVPDKSDIYSGMMPSSVRQMAREDRLSQVYSYLWKYSDMNVVEIRDQLVAASYDADVYYHTDNYLNDNGAFTTVNTLISKMSSNMDGVEPLETNDYEIEYAESSVKNLAMMMGKGDGYKEYNIAYTLKRKQQPVVTSGNASPFANLEEGETMKTPDINALFGEGLLAQLEADGNQQFTDNYINIVNDKAVNDLHVLFIHDEALVTSIPMISQAFSESSFILNNGDFTTRSIINEAPDIVVYEISEKYLANLLKD